MKPDERNASRKARIDALLLQLPGVSAGTINGLDAYFVGGRMFACIHGEGLAIRLPAATATDLQFARDNVTPFAPAGVASTREWIEIRRADPLDYEQDVELLRASVEHVKRSRTR